MARYLIVCDVDDIRDIRLSGRWDNLQCRDGSLELIPFQPTLMDLTFIQAGELFGATLLVFAVAWVLRQAIDFVLNKR